MKRRSNRHGRARPSVVVVGCSIGWLALGCASDESDATNPVSETPAVTTPVLSPPPRSASPTAEPGVDSTPAGSDSPGAASGNDDPATAEPPAVAESCDSFVGFDELYTRMQQDLRREDADDRVFLRYVSLANRLNQGACPADMEHDRLALIKAVNSVSTKTSIALPEAIGTDGALLRIDLRDLGWDQAVVVDGVAFRDGWEAIVAASEFAVEFEGDQADDLKQDADTLIPVLNADALIDVALKDNLYYELLGIAESEDEVIEQLGIDEEAQEEQKIVIRAGTSQSRLSRQPTVAERLELENRPGFYWSRYDLADATQDQSIFANPLDFVEDGIEAIFTLPNGLNAYVIFDAAGLRQTETDLIFDPNEADGAVENSVSCSSCHAAGLNPITDEVRAYVAANSRDFDADTFEEIQDSFLAQPEIDEVLERDVQIYESALQRAGLSGLKVDPVSTVYVRFDGDVTLAVAAGDLGVIPGELRDDLGFLSQQVDTQLSVLRSGSLGRAAFEELYLGALCAISISNENRPAAAACAEVGQ